ncbi:MAG TPA: PDZ domain-containing protein, partial [Xanthomonadaceae bacterium]|nr:PDZ domain-containing protein [Xanthomonadaceae bacterium]
TLGALDEAVADAPTRPGAGTGTASNPLGIVTQPLDAAERQRLGLGPDEGVAVVRINGMAARAAGLQPGDVILQVGRSKVGSPAQLDRLLAGVEPGQTVMLLVRNAAGRGFIAVTPRAAEE